MVFHSTLLLNSQSSFSLFPTTTPLSLIIPSSSSFAFSHLGFHSKLIPTVTLSASLNYSLSLLDDEDDDFVIGDCVVFDENAFEDHFLIEPAGNSGGGGGRASRAAPAAAEENLVPEKWREAQAEINVTKKDRRKIAQEMEFGCRVEKKRQGLAPVRNVNMEDYVAFRDAKLAQLNPIVLDNPASFGGRNVDVEESEVGGKDGGLAERASARNPRWAVYGKNLDDVTDFFNSGNYDASDSDKNSEGRRKLFSKEEKALLNKRTPDLEVATSENWVPLHSLAASGAFYLLDTLLKHNADVNVQDKDGWTAMHKAILGKKQAVMNYLLRESANPFVCDKDGATLMHYAVRAASSQAIKILLLYNVDINLHDNDGWTPLHLAVQARRLDIVKLLLIKGADKTIKNKDGLTPLGLCLLSGHETRTYELIKTLKLVPGRQ